MPRPKSIDVYLPARVSHSEGDAVGAWAPEPQLPSPPASSGEDPQPFKRAERGGLKSLRLSSLTRTWFFVIRQHASRTFEGGMNGVVFVH